ncbi:MAG TPA: MFS transporter [Candidatus Angelobacter sp.]|nr:MFS transporter [Candidatus Angelobacter sp.]
MENRAPAPVVSTHDSVLSPLREPLFRTLWIAAVISYTGSWMQAVATGWLMTSLTSSPMWVSLVTVAVSLPVLIIALPAGALADIVDRRKFLLFTQSTMVAAATVLGVMTLTRTVTPQVLLVFTFLLGVGAVMNDPAWQALTPDLVPPSKLAAAVALNSAGFNIARAVGPALGGLVIAAAGSGTTAGSGWAFLLNAVSFFGVILFLCFWKPAESARHNGNNTSFAGAIGVGLRYARQEPKIRAVLARTLAFAFFASSFWALLPLIASKFGAEGFGAMLAFFGLGALGGAGILSLARRRLSPDAVIFCATLIFAVGLCGLVRAHTLTVASAFSAAAGVAWIGILATLNTSAQTAAPSWVRARVISMYVLVLQGGLALGSALWGVVASRTSVEFTLTAAAIALTAGLVLAPWYRLQPASNG